MSDHSDISTDDKQRYKKEKGYNNIVVNIQNTQYISVQVAAEQLGYFVTKDPDIEWDLNWVDGNINNELLVKKSYKVSHFVDVSVIAKKNNLASNLVKMQKQFSSHFNFFPKTWIIPQNYNDLKLEMEKNPEQFYIVKPENSCQGKGIFLTNNQKKIEKEVHMVVQKYLNNPYLIDNLKFDLRLYVLITSSDPLLIYLYKDVGMARFATEKYIKPNIKNQQNMCMHLTNYAINKQNPIYQFNNIQNNKEYGHKRSYQSIIEYFKQQGHDINILQQKINHLIVSTVCAVQPIFAHAYKSSQPSDQKRDMCFQLLGFDVMIDSYLEPWLLEVNHSPSLSIDSQFDEDIKVCMVTNILKMLNLSVDRRNKLKQEKKQSLRERLQLKHIQKNSCQEEKDQKLNFLKKDKKYNSKKKKITNQSIQENLQKSILKIQMIQQFINHLLNFHYNNIFKKQEEVLNQIIRYFTQSKKRIYLTIIKMENYEFYKYCFRQSKSLF